LLATVDRRYREPCLGQITQLLAKMQAGDETARDALFAAAYQDLRRLAVSRLRDGGRNTVLDTTSLVHECYLRFVKVGALRIEDRQAFFGYASRVMRSVIVDSVRERLAERRGGGQSPLRLTTELIEGLADGGETILKVHEALEVLAKVNARLVKVVEMRYFGGYSEREIAEALGVTERTVQRDWEKARGILEAVLR
jgi:RNA polymerase sigma factor (TIGR02999 family)